MKNILIIILTLLISTNLFSQDFSKTQINTIKISNSVYMLTGAGGNIGLLVGKDGVFMIDDQFAPLTEKIRKAIKNISNEPIKYVFNTHWHYDHTGGNENFGKSGSVIVAHKNVRKLLSKDQLLKVFGRKVPAKTKEGLPVITFNSEINFHLNNEHLNVFHVKNAHTNGDSIIHFKNSNVFHMGDTLFINKFPFVDVQHGGSLNGIINAIEKVLKKSNNKTAIIPGHGPLTNKSEVSKYLKTLKDVKNRLTKLKSKKKTLKQVLELKPLNDLNKTWGSGFMKTDQFISIVYPTL